MSEEEEQEQQGIQILINKKFCKGCGICVEFCPQHVLAMERNYPVVVNLEACTACQLCDARCPDFAITVVGERRKKKVA
ncbi:MAG: 4Fe-4S binding protein [Calditrichaeota bacterium]|nr:4Fe-4S binding protein [Calditrichota bacterium]